MSLLTWIHDSIGVDGQRGAEVRTQCPKCGHSNFYFNLNKQVGHCHSASCHWNPRLKDLIEHVGYGPEKIGFYQPRIEKPVVEAEIELPGGVLPVLFYEGPILMTNNEVAYEYLKGRNIADSTIVRFEIQATGNRIFLSVREAGKLESYVSRSINKKGYLYPEGGRHSRTLLGFDECKLWDRLVLVENSFVSLWLRGENCSTNFGSHLSTFQIDKIKNSKIKRVIILWDEGAEIAAEKAVRALRSAGVRAITLSINGQPDDHSIEEIREFIKKAEGAIDNRGVFVYG